MQRPTRVGLHIDAPHGRVEAVEGEGALLAEALNLVNVLVASIVARPGQALGILVGEDGSVCLHHGDGGVILPPWWGTR